MARIRSFTAIDRHTNGEVVEKKNPVSGNHNNIKIPKEISLSFDSKSQSVRLDHVSDRALNVFQRVPMLKKKIFVHIKFLELLVP
jgi:hypothetical protein